MVKNANKFSWWEAGPLRISQPCADKYRGKWDDSWRSRRRQNNSKNWWRQPRFILSLCAVKTTSLSPETLFIWITYCGNIGNPSFLVPLTQKHISTHVTCTVSGKIFEMLKKRGSKKLFHEFKTRYTFFKTK